MAKDIIVRDNFLSSADWRRIYDLTQAQDFWATDDMPEEGGSGISGYMSSSDNIDEATEILFAEARKFGILANIIDGSDYQGTIYNKYPGKCPTHFHTDSDEGGWTFIYFQDTADYNFKLGGETQIYQNGQIRGIMPVPNRLMAFDGSLYHRGMSFNTDQTRYSFAVQFEDPING